MESEISPRFLALAGGKMELLSTEMRENIEGSGSKIGSSALDILSLRYLSIVTVG